MNINLKGKDTIIDLTQDNIEQIDLISEESTIELKRSNTDKKFIIKFSDAVFFTLMNSFKEE